MKRIGLIISLLLLIAVMQAQIITDKTSKKYTIGFDIYTDIMTDHPNDYNPAGFNPGFNTYVTYNIPLSVTQHVFAMGIGISSHNYYSDSRIEDVNANITNFKPIIYNYKRSKLNLTYLDIPAELRFKFENKAKLGIGFKVGFLIDSKDKYIGDESIKGQQVTVKRKRIDNLETYAYGPTIRFGYKWFSVYGYYEIGRTFTRNLGPTFNPVSVGLTISPF